MSTLLYKKYVPLIEDADGEFVQVEGTVFDSFAKADVTVQALGFEPTLHSWEGESESEIIYRNRITDTLLVLEEYNG